MASYDVAEQYLAGPKWRHRDTRRLGIPDWTGLPLSDDGADAAYGRLHDKHSGGVRDLVMRMRGFYFKNAQLLSTRDDFLPAQYLQWMKETQAGSQPRQTACSLHQCTRRHSM